MSTSGTTSDGIRYTLNGSGSHAILIVFTEHGSKSTQLGDLPIDWLVRRLSNELQSDARLNRSK